MKHVHVGGRIIRGEILIVRLYGPDDSADLGGSSNDSIGIFED